MRWQEVTWRAVAVKWTENGGNKESQLRRDGGEIVGSLHFWEKNQGPSLEKRVSSLFFMLLNYCFTLLNAKCDLLHIIIAWGNVGKLLKF